MKGNLSDNLVHNLYEGKHHVLFATEEINLTSIDKKNQTKYVHFAEREGWMCYAKEGQF